MVSDLGPRNKDRQSAEGEKDMTNLLQFHQGLLLNTILFKVILRSVDDFLNDLFVDLTLQTCQYGSLAWPPPPMCKPRLNKGITNGDGVRHDSD
jgi:hypothetical protein